VSITCRQQRRRWAACKSRVPENDCVPVDGLQSDVASPTGGFKSALPGVPQVAVSGLESDGRDQFFCGGGSSGKVRAVRRSSAAGAESEIPSTIMACPVSRATAIGLVSRATPVHTAMRNCTRDEATLCGAHDKLAAAGCGDWFDKRASPCS
jgi:hypothetical protein